MHTKGWMHRVLEEKCKDLKNLTERISNLNHQIENIDEMPEEWQDKVRIELVSDLSDYDWKNAITEVLSQKRGKEQ